MTDTLDLYADVSSLPYVGPRTTKSLNRAGIFTIRDLFYYFPRSYEEYQAPTNIADLTPGKVTIHGRVVSTSNRTARSRHLNITEAIISDGTDSIRAVWFNQPYRVKQLEDNNREFIFSGNYEFKNGRYQLTAPTVKVAQSAKAAKNTKTAKTAQITQPAKTPTAIHNNPSKNPDESQITESVYSAKSGLKPADFRKLFNHLRPEFAKIPDLLPMTEGKPNFVKKNARRSALFATHFAEDEKEIETARKYLAYEELFELILAAELNKKEAHKLKATPIKYDDSAMHELINSLPFELTKDQKTAAWEIIQDLGKKSPMNRLLQGDVGSGKTIVAAIAAYQAAKNGLQTAILAPTAVLATQHAESLQRILAPLGVSIGLLIGSTKQKNILKQQLAQGNIDLIIGTHAIITDDTQFKNLGLCIIDEQHRFGVNQRQKLLLKSPDGLAPHLLSMTATPIPRSLQLTVFGDLDVSIIKEMPKGRQPIETKVLSDLHMRESLYPRIREELKNGRQVYWICKTIEDSPTQETISVKKQAEKLETIFVKNRVAFLHGRMKPAEKDKVMEDFANHKIDILVSTTVVEVGVDVPNSTVMVIMDAENYGLAQLHQLRGRVGRGKYQSYCYLIITGENKPTRRLRELEKSTDGFHLAEVDLKIRGPGEIYGNIQHGMLDLRVANLSDTDLIAAARRHVKVLAKDPEIMLKYKELEHNIQRYQQLTTLN
ncbi:ATP-dependent DNA helicase RecG [Candidatus Saccharibacteria bacterium]|nr:ATP-dependent DNA helicase RecG [Candidatus Saccharibacteria bacterium]